MFSYYGSKSKVVKFYPPPVFDTIVEPFAGAAWYSVLHRERQVVLIERSPVVFGIWDWLINKASSELLLQHSDFYLGQDISDLELEKPHADLLGFCINRGSSVPKTTVMKWSCQVASRPEWASTVSFQIRRIARLLPEIKHWKVLNCSYELSPNIKATWFIDPPYQSAGRYYPYNKIDYSHLSKWARARRGQAIVCETHPASWLPFKQLVDQPGQRRLSKELIWTN